MSNAPAVTGEPTSLTDPAITTSPSSSTASPIAPCATVLLSFGGVPPISVENSSPGSITRAAGARASLLNAKRFASSRCRPHSMRSRRPSRSRSNHRCVLAHPAGARLRLELPHGRIHARDDRPAEILARGAALARLDPGLADAARKSAVADQLRSAFEVVRRAGSGSAADPPR